jgi:hypothetical protein
MSSLKMISEPRRMGEKVNLCLLSCSKTMTHMKNFLVPLMGMKLVLRLYG